MADRLDTLARAELECAEDWNQVIRDIPALRFPSAWSVKIIPPFGGAMVRFIAAIGEGASVSVYADFHEALGYFGEPHWEIYPGVSGENERFAIAETGALIDEIRKSLRKQRAANRRRQA